MQKLELKNTALEGVLTIKPPTDFEDFRGSYVEIYNETLFHEAGITIPFIQDDISTSRKNVLRGVHGDDCTWKLVSCLQGSFYLLVVNNDPLSSQFRKWEAFTLSEHNRFQVLIPPNFGNGHLVLTDQAIFHYKQSTQYDRERQFTIAWNDPAYEFWWPITNPIVSVRDQGRH